VLAAAGAGCSRAGHAAEAPCRTTGAVASACCLQPHLPQLRVSVAELALQGCRLVRAALELLFKACQGALLLVLLRLREAGMKAARGRSTILRMRGHLPTLFACLGQATSNPWQEKGQTSRQ
jgi:hypothetical protein